MINQKSIKNNIQFPGITKKMKPKNEIKFIQNNSFNFNTTTMKNQQTQASLQ